MRIFLDVSYEEFQPETYEGISLSTMCEKVSTVNTGDFFKDIDAIMNIAEKQKMNLICLSSFDHFLMDNQELDQRKVTEMLDKYFR